MYNVRHNGIDAAWKGIVKTKGFRRTYLLSTSFICMNEWNDDDDDDKALWLSWNFK